MSYIQQLSSGRRGFGKHSHSKNQFFHSLYSANKPAHKAAYFIFSLIHETICMLLTFILSYVVVRQHGFLFEISLNGTIPESYWSGIFGKDWKTVTIIHDIRVYWGCLRFYYGNARDDIADSFISYL